MSIEKIIASIKNHKRYLILAHIGLEGDSIGCQLAFKRMLEKMGKEASIVNGEELPSQYNFLGIEKSIATDVEKDIDYDAAVVLDCPVIKRVGKAKRLLKKGKPILNIDHHISNDNFGDVNWVEADASSCGEMVYDLYKRMNIPIDEEVALCLYVAILTDTGSFAYESTSSKTHRMAADLIDTGVNPLLIHQLIYENRTLSEVELLKDALSTIKLDGGGEIAYMHVSRSMLDKHKLGLDITEGFINYARSIKSAKVAIIFFEDPTKTDLIQLSFRSKGEVNVDRIAALFGGGGHKNAAGCVIEGPLKKVIKDVLSKVKENI